MGFSVTCQPLSFALSITPGEVTLLALVNTALQLTSEGKPHELNILQLGWCTKQLRTVSVRAVQKIRCTQ